MEAATPFRSHAKSSNATCPAPPATFVHQNLPPPSPSLMARRVFVAERDVKTQPVVSIPPLLCFSPLTKISKVNPANGSLTPSKDVENNILSSKPEVSVQITTPMKIASISNNTPSKQHTPSLRYIPAASEKRKSNYPPLPFTSTTPDVDAKNNGVPRTPLRLLAKRNLDSSSFSSTPAVEAPPQGLQSNSSFASPAKSLAQRCPAPISSNILETPKTSRKSVVGPFANQLLETPKTSRKSIAVPFATQILETPKTSRKSIAVMSTEMSPMTSRKESLMKAPCSNQEDHIRSHVESMLKKVLSLPPESSNPARRVFVKNQPSAPSSSTPNVHKTPNRKSQIDTVLHSEKENAAAASNSLKHKQEDVQTDTCTDQANTGHTGGLVVYANGEGPNNGQGCNGDNKLGNNDNHDIKQTLEEADQQKLSGVTGNELAATGEINMLCSDHHNIKQPLEKVEGYVSGNITNLNASNVCLGVINTGDLTEAQVAAAAVVPVLRNEDADKSEIDGNAHNLADDSGVVGSCPVDGNDGQGSHVSDGDVSGNVTNLNASSVCLGVINTRDLTESQVVVSAAFAPVLRKEDAENEFLESDKSGIDDKAQNQAVDSRGVGSYQVDGNDVQGPHVSDGNDVQGSRHAFVNDTKHSDGSEHNGFEGSHHADGNDTEGEINEAPMMPKVLFNEVNASQDVEKEAVERVTSKADNSAEAKKLVKNRKSLQSDTQQIEKVSTRRTAATARKPPIPTRTSERKRSVNSTTVMSIPDRVKENQHKDTGETKRDKITAIIDGRKKSPENQHKNTDETKPAKPTVTANGRKKSPENQRTDSNETKPAKVTSTGNGRKKSPENQDNDSNETKPSKVTATCDGRKKSLLPPRSSIASRSKETQNKVKAPSGTKKT